MRTWLVLALLAATPTWAYIPPSQFIAKEIAKKRAGQKLVKIRSTIAAKGAGAASFRETTWIDYSARKIRSVAFNESGVELFAITRKLNEIPLGGATLLENNTIVLTSALINAGIPILQESELLTLKDEEARRAAELTSLDRLKGVPSWVIGPKNTTPQLWVNKDQILPSRLVYEGKGDWDLNFLDYRMSLAFPYPKTIDEEGFRVDLVELTSVSEARELRELAQGFTEAGTGAASAVRDLIEKYYRVLR